jgi:HTH-type transcriptional regulator, competence development regulator
MTFGERVRALRKARRLTLRATVAPAGMAFTYLSRVEAGGMTYGDYSSAKLIRLLPVTLVANGKELLFLAKMVPDSLRRRIFERPDAFRRFARLNDKRHNRLPALLGGN